MNKILVLFSVGGLLITMPLVNKTATSFHSLIKGLYTNSAYSMEVVYAFSKRESEMICPVACLFIASVLSFCLLVSLIFRQQSYYSALHVDGKTQKARFLQGNKMPG